MPIIIRVATDADLVALVDMQEAQRQEVQAYESLTFNRELCTENMAGVISNPINLILVAVDGSEVIGYMWLVYVQPHFTYDFYYSEIYTYIKKSRRNSPAMTRLISKAKLISTNSGASYLQIGSFTGNKKLSQAYHKRYKLIGEVFDV